MYAILSDQHAHKWSQFATTDARGVNSRLEHILSELKRAAKELQDAGGHNMVFAGDLFHTRGSIDPEVFNPVYETIKSILATGTHIWAIPGNHDLASRETTELGNAIQTLGHLKNFHVVTQFQMLKIGDHDIAMIPWISKLDDLRTAVRELGHEYKWVPKANVDLIIHAGIEGVLTGLAQGLSVKEVEDWGYRRVFAGHYHNHKIMADGAVISIGALTHQTFSDVGTKAGFLLVDDKSVTYRASHAPSFVDIDPDTPEEEIPLRADGNFVRVRGFKLTDKEVNIMRQGLLDMGAKGVTIQVARETTSARGAPVAKAMGLEVSISNFIDGAGFEKPADVKAACEALLAKARAYAS